MVKSREVTGIILAGGDSRRMGDDKALAIYRGERLLEAVSRAIAPAVSEVLIVGPERPTLTLQARYIVDAFPGEGPLGGLISGLRSSADTLAFVVGCDMPNVSPALFDRLVTAWNPGDGAVVAEIGGRLQPLQAVYATGELPLLESVFASGGRSLLDGLSTLRVRLVHVTTESEAASFSSIDTPDQLIP